ncbi:MAG: response regulator [Acidobacteriota bacterium]
MDVPKILILDDREDYLRALQAALRRDFEAVCARSLQEAVQLMDATVQVALVDVRLSEQEPANREGLVFLEKLRERYPATPVIMMSAYRDVDALETLVLGADFFLRKPIDLRELRALLRDFAQHGRMPEKTAQLRTTLHQEEHS